MLPRCTTEAMTLHLAEIAQAVAPGSHAVLLLDQAGWHVSRKLKVPPNITLLPLPAKAPELNPVENIWQYLQGELDLQPGVHVLHGHTRSLLRSLEQADRPALDHHVHRPARSLYVRDVDASATFYATVLGLEEIPNRVGKSHIRWFTIDGFRTFHLIGGDLNRSDRARSPRTWRSRPETSRRRSLAWSSTG